jgi:ABC-type proline/glycine betaine transport system substrate-binding protein
MNLNEDFSIKAIVDINKLFWVKSPSSAVERKYLDRIVDSAYLIANRQLKTKLSPRALSHLMNIRLSIEAITEMDRSMNFDKLSAREAAAHWIAAHPDQVNRWQPK